MRKRRPDHLVPGKEEGRLRKKKVIGAAFIKITRKKRKKPSLYSERRGEMIGKGGEKKSRSGEGGTRCPIEKEEKKLRGPSSFLKKETALSPYFSKGRSRHEKKKKRTKGAIVLLTRGKEKKRKSSPVGQKGGIQKEKPTVALLYEEKRKGA